MQLALDAFEHGFNMCTANWNLIDHMDVLNVRLSYYLMKTKSLVSTSPFETQLVGAS